MDVDATTAAEHDEEESCRSLKRHKGESNSSTDDRGDELATAAAAANTEPSTPVVLEAGIEKDTPVDNSNEQQQEQQQGAQDESAAGAAAPTAAPAVVPPAAVGSVNQAKRQKRLEKLMRVKERKKQHKKEVRAAKAAAAGRDVAAEQKFMAERAATGDGNQRRQEYWEQNKLPLTAKSFQVCVDCAYQSQMTSKEINSLAQQIRYCYSANKRTKHPCLLAATSLEGETMDHIKNVSGWEGWHKRAFTLTSQPLEEYYKEAGLDRIIYLTSDSENTLVDLDDSKIYVIGGIVDRNRLKRAAITRAERLGVATAKLPIDQHLKKMEATRVLTCNHVFEIMLKYRENGKSWQKALLDVLPRRKDAKPLDDDQDSQTTEEQNKIELNT